MRQTKQIFIANFAPATTTIIATFDKAGAKIRILTITGGNGSFSVTRVRVKDSSRFYDFILGPSGAIDIPTWVDSYGQLRSAIELEGNVTFEISNDNAAAGLVPAAAGVFYDITYDRQNA